MLMAEPVTSPKNPRPSNRPDQHPDVFGARSDGAPRVVLLGSHQWRWINLNRWKHMGQSQGSHARLAKSNIFNVLYSYELWNFQGAANDEKSCTFRGLVRMHNPVMKVLTETRTCGLRADEILRLF